MDLSFAIAAAVALASTGLAITRRDPVHALLYLIVSFLASAAVLFLLGAPFVAALEVVIYAGAILVFFVFTVMLLETGEGRRARPGLRSWLGPAALAAVLLGELLFLAAGGAATDVRRVAPGEVGATLFGPWVVAAQLAGMLLLAGMVGAFHLSRRPPAGGGSS